jgi:hypothetical protein
MVSHIRRGSVSLLVLAMGGMSAAIVAIFKSRPLPLPMAVPVHHE